MVTIHLGMQAEQTYNLFSKNRPSIGNCQLHVLPGLESKHIMWPLLVRAYEAGVSLKSPHDDRIRASAMADQEIGLPVTLDGVVAHRLKSVFH